MTRGCKALPVLVIGSLLAACGNNSHPTRGSVHTPAPSMTSIATSTVAPTLSPTAQPASPTPAPTQGPASTPPQHTSPHNSPPTRPHVLLIMLENKGYGATLGSCAADAYLCSLASQYMSATAWYSMGHPSLPNYLAVTSGSTQGCSGDACPVGISATDLGGQLTTAGIPWQAYMESMPSACDDIASNGAYTRVHNPFAYFTDNASRCHDVPYPGSTGLIAALDGSAAPDFVWISPNLNDDMHNGSVQQGDAWLRANLAPVLDSPWFTRDRATVIVTMDENDLQPAPAGGQIPFVVISSTARGAGALTTHGNLYGTLRSIEETFGLRLLGAAQVPSNGDVVRYFG
jgi:hypothetical protein